jgi:hemolysin activation/secretion protein
LPLRSNATGWSLAWLALAFAAVPAAAQQAASQPGFDPRQTEREFDTRRSEQSRVARSAVRLPRIERAEQRADSRKLIDLRAVSVAGAHTLPRDEIARIYQPFLGKKVSQADLVAIDGDQRAVSRGRISLEPGHRSAAGHCGRPSPHQGD